MLEFPEMIKRVRKKLGEDGTTFGKRFKASKSMVSRWENGNREAPYKVIYFCTKYYNNRVFQICPHCDGKGILEKEEV